MPGPESGRVGLPGGGINGGKIWLLGQIPNRAPRADLGVCEQVSVGAASQRGVMILAALLALGMFHRF